VIPVDFLLGAFIGYQIGKRAGAPMTGLLLGMLVGCGLIAFEVWKAAKYGANGR
jgi:F0F1-type ATP synthase assembly protein I